MSFEWDEAKNEANWNKHGISFEEAVAIFNGIIFTRIDDPEDYREIREISIGTIQGLVVIVVIHADRNNVTRIISARRANANERKLFYEHLQKEIG